MMRTENRANYASRIERAIALLERNTTAGQATSLDDLASAAALSPYHFHRIFRVMTGETVGTAVVRVRLGGSLPHLDRNILDAADSSGYATGQAFARAFKHQTGATPSALRSDPELRKDVETTLATPPRPSGPRPPLTIAIASVDPLRLAIVRNIGDYAELNGGFARVFEHISAQVGPEAITGLYGLPHDDPRDVEPQNCRFDCAVSVNGEIEVDGEVSVSEFAGGSALQLVHEGDYDRVHAAIDALYFEAVRRDIPLAAEPILIHYLHDPEEVPADELIAHVYLRVDA